MSVYERSPWGSSSTVCAWSGVTDPSDMVTANSNPLQGGGVAGISRRGSGGYVPHPMLVGVHERTRGKPRRPDQRVPVGSSSPGLGDELERRPVKLNRVGADGGGPDVRPRVVDVPLRSRRVTGARSRDLLPYLQAEPIARRTFRHSEARSGRCVGEQTGRCHVRRSNRVNLAQVNRELHPLQRRVIDLVDTDVSAGRELEELCAVFVLRLHLNLNERL